MNEPLDWASFVAEKAMKHGTAGVAHALRRTFDIADQKGWERGYNEGRSVGADVAAEDLQSSYDEGFRAAIAATPEFDT